MKKQSAIRFYTPFVLAIVMFSHSISASASPCDYSWTQNIPVSVNINVSANPNDLDFFLEVAISQCEKNLNQLFSEIGQVCHESCKRRGEFCVSNAHQSSRPCYIKSGGIVIINPPFPTMPQITAEGFGSITCTCTGS